MALKFKVRHGFSVTIWMSIKISYLSGKWNLGLITFDNLGDWCMTNVDPDFSEGRLKKGDIMVVGKNMGCGHSHQQANKAIKQCGISCVIAESFDRNFFRNSIDIGNR